MQRAFVNADSKGPYFIDMSFLSFSRFLEVLKWPSALWDLQKRSLLPSKPMGSGLWTMQLPAFVYKGNSRLP